MSKRSLHCELMIFSLLLCQTAVCGLLLTGRWLYLLALMAGAIASVSCLKQLLEQKPPEPPRAEHHYHLYYTAEAPNRVRFPNNHPPTRW